MNVPNVKLSIDVLIRATKTVQEHDLTKRNCFKYCSLSDTKSIKKNSQLALSSSQILEPVLFQLFAKYWPALSRRLV